MERLTHNATIAMLRDIAAQLKDTDGAQSEQATRMALRSLHHVQSRLLDHITVMDEDKEALRLRVEGLFQSQRVAHAQLDVLQREVNRMKWGIIVSAIGYVIALLWIASLR